MAWWPSRGLAVLAAIVILAAPLGACSWHPVTRGRFSFDGVTFRLLPSVVEQLGGPITEAEQRTIKDVAWRELRAAYAEFRVALSETEHAPYQVQVVDNDRTRYGGAGQSLTMGALGGRGTVDFGLLTSYALHYAPPGADRRIILDGIGCGIGRAAAHEFAHQFIPGFNLHANRDPATYEYGSADRVQQYYGPMHWGTARSALLTRVGGA
jgi:hypothetical protein